MAKTQHKKNNIKEIDEMKCGGKIIAVTTTLFINKLAMYCNQQDHHGKPDDARPKQ
jgi:hypothetical protein